MGRTGGREGGGDWGGYSFRIHEGIIMYVRYSAVLTCSVYMQLIVFILVLTECHESSLTSLFLLSR